MDCWYLRVIGSTSSMGKGEGAMQPELWAPVDRSESEKPNLEWVDLGSKLTTCCFGMVGLFSDVMLFIWSVTRLECCSTHAVYFH